MRGPSHRQIRGEVPVRDERVPEGDVVAYPPELAPLRDVEAQLLPDLPPDRCRRALPAVDRTAEEGPVSGRRDGRDVVAKLQRVAARNRQDGEGDRRWAPPRGRPRRPDGLDRKSTRLNSSHITISYAVFCLKKKKQT